ncbi:hypothetical protein BDC45DRAFT_533331 [Circinella umbellata]|nr:hypothetical protein BDC45DRAFT_533331 [Circinella umbellata]
MGVSRIQRAWRLWRQTVEAYLHHYYLLFSHSLKYCVEKRRLESTGEKRYQEKMMITLDVDNFNKYQSTSKVLARMLAVLTFSFFFFISCYSNFGLFIVLKYKDFQEAENN